MQNLIEYFYSYSPIWMQQVMVSTYGWWWFRRRFSDQFLRLVEEYRSRDSWTKERFQDYQTMLLEKLL
ncbi:MAG: hypothetical protein J2P31_03500, partial [Blastocatellia bacterium]|nr:hypothetical protein [Blastocatellia bacterium]